MRSAVPVLTLFLTLTLALAQDPRKAPTPGAPKVDAEQQEKIDKDEDNAYANLQIFAKALQLIRQDYVEGGKVSYRELTYSALKGMLSALDPHSQFLEPEGFKEMQDDTRSRYDGLGLVVSTQNGVLAVVTPLDGGPAAKAGIMSGDVIVKINGKPTDKLDVNEAVGLLKGKPNEKCLLTVLRPSTREVKEHELTRTEIKVDTVKDVRLITDATSGAKIGFVRITQFNEPTAEDLAKRLDELTKQGMNALILDVRNNPGGLLNSAVDVCALFVQPGTMVCYTDGRAPSANRIYRTAASPNVKPRLDLPIAVLINNGSASGAEIVAGALKDLNRAIAVGEKTFGKGSVQSVISLPDNSALRLTTAKYFTPSRQVIHEKGIEPSIRSVLTPEQERALSIRRNADQHAEAERREAEAIRDPQLDRAVDALKGMLIYRQQQGGGKKDK
ncbi:MAG: S41 family peptidase [Verrucomicrobia bacterium]|nr:S41 family peptidase [Verrucomicrobiota bacterium]